MDPGIISALDDEKPGEWSRGGALLFASALLAELCGFVLCFVVLQRNDALFVDDQVMRLTPFASVIVGSVVFGMTVPVVAFRSQAVAAIVALTSKARTIRWLLIGGSVAFSLLAVWILRAFPNSGDEYDYLFQAETFLAGRLWNPLPPIPELFTFFHQSFHDSKWFTLYQPGWPLLLAAGMGLWLPSWLVCPIAGGLLLYGTAKLAYRRDGELGAVLAVGLVGLSPFFIFNAGSYFNHVPAAAAGLLFCWAAASFLERPETSKACVAGAALGILGVIRTADVLIFALPFFVEFCWRAKARHCRLTPLIIISGLPFLVALLLYYHALQGTLLPDIHSDNPSVHFGLAGIDEAGNPVALMDQLQMAAARTVGLAAWTSPLLVLGFFGAFARLVALRRLSFVDLIFPACVIGYLLVPFTGGNQYGPRYYFEGFPFLVLSLVSGLTPLLRDTTRMQRITAGTSVLAAHCALSLTALVTIGFWERAVIDQRMDLYDQVYEQQLRNAVVVVHSATGKLSPMDPRDLTRNGIAADGDVIYVLDIPEKLTELQRVFPERRFYLYERDAENPRGSLRPLTRPTPTG